MGKNIFNLHKSIDKKRELEFAQRLEPIRKAFLQFQVDHDARCAIVNELQGAEGYPPNLIVDLICNQNHLTWRPMGKEEKEQILKVIEKKEKDIAEAEKEK